MLEKSWIDLGPTDSLKDPPLREISVQGKPMKGFVYVGPAGCKTGKALSEWICLGIDYTKTLKK